jgi:L-asparagine transporter-like permease
MNFTTIWNYMWKALFNDQQGFSIRKATGALFSLFIVIITSVYTDSDNFEYVLTAYLSAIMTLYGMTHIANTAQRKIEMKERVEMKKAENPITPTAEAV